MRAGPTLRHRSMARSPGVLSPRRRAKVRGQLPVLSSNLSPLLSPGGDESIEELEPWAIGVQRVNVRSQVGPGLDPRGCMRRACCNERRRGAAAWATPRGGLHSEVSAGGRAALGREARALVDEQAARAPANRIDTRQRAPLCAQTGWAACAAPSAALAPGAPARLAPAKADCRGCHRDGCWKSPATAPRCSLQHAKQVLLLSYRVRRAPR